MLGCRLTFEACTKAVKQRAIKCFLRTTEVLSGADGHVVTQVQYLSKIVFRATKPLHVLLIYLYDFFRKVNFVISVMFRPV